MGRRPANPTREQIIAAASAAIRDPNADWSDAKKFKGDDVAMRGISSVFELLRTEPSAVHIRGCAHAVYGWMPRMLGDVDVEEAKRVMADGVTPASTQFVNGSWVGTSKFLFFWRPCTYVIWDSRVDRSLRNQQCALSIQSASDYLSYCSAIHEVSEDESLSQHVPPPLLSRGYSPPRIIEVALYVLGKPPPKERKN